MTDTSKALELADDLMELHEEATSGKWGKGRTTHETVSTQDDRPPYLIANFHHAKDASFVDACHEHLPTLVTELRRQHAEIAELKAELERIRALEPVAWLHKHPHCPPQAFTNEPPPSLKAKCAPLYTLPPNLKV